MSHSSLCTIAYFLVIVLMIDLIISTSLVSDQYNVLIFRMLRKRLEGALALLCAQRIVMC